MDNPLGIVSCHLQDAGPEQLLRRAQQYGLAGVEWFECSPTPYTDGEGCERLAALAAQLGMANTYHAPWADRWSLASQPEAEIEATVRDLVGRAGRLEARVMTLHLGHCAEDASRLDAVGKVAGVLCACAPLLEQADVWVGVENVRPTQSPYEVACTEEELAVVMSTCASPRVGLTLDTGHANILGSTDAILRRWGERILNVHLHDNDGVSDQHLPPGSGTIDWDALLARLKGLGPAVAMTLEFPESSGETAGFIERIRAV